MRVLLTSHRPLNDGIAGRRLATLRTELSRTHEVWVVQASGMRDASEDVRVIVCSANDPAADLPFDPPTLDDDMQARRTFASLSNSRLAAYREAFRTALDAEIEGFNPDVVHAQHLWIDGHLVLESGAPYVVSADWQEWEVAQKDGRYLRYLQETAENAGRILTDDLELRATLADRFELAPDRFASASLSVEQLGELYREVHERRFGRR